MKSLFQIILISFTICSIIKAQQGMAFCKQKKSFFTKQPEINMESSLIGDTIHVRHYDITLDTINFSTKFIRGKCTINVQAKMNGVNNISLSLLKMQIDSVKTAQQALSYSYNDTIISISTPSLMNIADSLQLTVWYKGNPQQDSYWGGFYFSGIYAYNMGVGFNALPHNYGRVWFPCIDEFTDRATYQFHITTPSTYKAFCNGVLQSETDNGNGTKTWHWKLNQTIPTYLASVAVAPFYTLSGNASGIPVEWAVMATDTFKTLNTFANLQAAVNLFINSYGPHGWDKIGYIAVPFGAGAMEHATSIHIGKGYIDGTKNYETLWAHELSHHWWGDQVTCDKAEEMWLNEGWASYSEYLFTESVYGISAYKTDYRPNHRSVLQFAHIEDGNYHALNNVPQAYTYGTTSYNKGADVIHTLRNYMGDAKFFQGCKAYMNNLAFGNANSVNLRNQLTASSGIDMTRFFEDWVMTPGFPHFSIDSMSSIFNGNNYAITIYTKQKQKGNNHVYSMPLECNLANGINDTTIVLMIDSATNSFNTIISFSPVWVSLDRKEKISDAVTDFEQVISTIGTKTFPETKVSLSVQSAGTDSSVVRIEHHWVAADPFMNNPGIRVSNYHYFGADGLWANGFYSKATFTYDGSTSLSLGYLDNTLITGTEDSLLILYRKGAWDEWKKVNSYTHNKGLVTDKKGSFIIDTLKKGEYTFGYYDYTVASEVKDLFIPESDVLFVAIPNPVKQMCTFQFTAPEDRKNYITVFDIAGKMVYSTIVYAHQEFITLDVSRYSRGTYIAQLISDGKVLAKTKVVLAD